MPRYRVLVNGERVPMKIDGVTRTMGLFAIRAVDAANDAEAGRAAVQMIARELALELTGAAQGPRFAVEKVDMVPWWWRRLLSPSGFTVYGEDEGDTDEGS